MEKFHWRDTIEERFWRWVRKTDTCWEWKGHLSHGYGSFTFHNHRDKAHRVSWELANGPVPEGLFVCHHCDNRKCVRPDHLFLGDAFDNMGDAARKGRMIGMRGELSPHSRLTEEDVHGIRFLAAEGIPRKQIAKDYGIVLRHVSQVISGRRWAHV